MTRTTKTSTRVCGFCSTGSHDRCPGGILNGDMVTVVLCACAAHPQVVRCLDCNARTDVDPNTYACLDPDACAARNAARRRATLKELYGHEEGREARMVAEGRAEAPKVKEAPKERRAGQCLCCGEATGGGLFRPGHDARYLSTAVKAVQAGERLLNNELDRWAEQGISEALRAKLVKRVAA